MEAAITPYDATDWKRKAEEIIAVLVRRRRWALSVAAVIFAGFFLYALLGTKYYASSATLIGQADSSLSSIGAMMGGGGLSLSPMSLIKGGGQNLDYKILNILRSRDLYREVATRSGLLAYYYDDEWDEAAGKWKDGFAPNMDEFHETFASKIFDSWYDEENFAVKFSVITADPEMSHKVAATVLEVLQELMNDQANSKAGHTRLFLESRIEQVKGEMAAAEEQLKAFQITHRIYMPDSQISGALEIMATLEAEKLANEIELGIVSKYSQEGSPKVKLIQDTIGEITSKIEKLRLGDEKEGGQGNGQLVPPLEQAPELQLQFLQLKRNVMVYEKLYTLLMAENEYEKIKEKKADLSFVVVDHPKVAEKKCKPRRMLVVLAGLMLSVIAGGGAAFARESWPDAKGFLVEAVRKAQHDDKQQ